MRDTLATIEARYEEIDRLLADPEFSTDYTRIQSLAKEQASIRNLVTLSREHRGLAEELAGIREMLRDDSDPELAELAREELAELEGRMATTEIELQMALLPSDPNDEKNVMMEIRAGTGGEEAGLFAAELYRMYARYAQKSGWRIEVMDANETGLGAIKEIVFIVRGDSAFSRLKHESGTHRVQRIPVTESGGRLHTSAATVAVLPEAEEIDVDVRAEDLDIDIYHASGHGGQNVQKVATAVRITHRPTGLVATCQDERSQFKNKEKAMSVLRSRLFAREQQRQHQEVSASRRSQVGSGDRSQRVRTYNYPQNRVTDHRVGLTTYNLDSVLEGGIDDFVRALSEQEQAQRLERVSL